MNLSGISCYYRKSIFSKKSTIFSEQFIKLFFSMEIRFKDLFNSNDFSQFSVVHLNLSRIYYLKDTFSSEKRLFIISKENSVFLEEDLIKKTFFKKLKNFSYWQFNEWIFEKESHINFYFNSSLFFKFLLASPGNYYIDSFISAWLKKEKIFTWIALVTIDIFHSLDISKELCWNLKSIASIVLKKINKDVLFNFMSFFSFAFNQAAWKFFSNVLNNGGLNKTNLICCIFTIRTLKILL